MGDEYEAGIEGVDMGGWCGIEGATGGWCGIEGVVGGWYGIKGVMEVGMELRVL